MSDPMSDRASLLKQLKNLGIEKVIAQYNGEGDSGQIDEIDFGQISVPPDIVNAIEGLFYDYLEQLYSGWENNEGAYGQFSWELRPDKIHLEHNTRVVSEETEESVL